MRWKPAAIIGSIALACATACGGGSGHDNVTITTQTSFPQGLLPVPFSSLDGETLSDGSGDVALKIDGDLFAVDGRTAIVTKVSRATGAAAKFARNVGGASNALTSITAGFGDDGRLFVGDVDGEIWIVNTDGTSSAEPFVDFGGQPVTGLAFAPDTFTGFGGQLFAAAGTAGIRRSGDPTGTFAPGNYVDVGFSGTTLFAIDDATDSIVTVSASGVAVPLSSTPAFNDPVGMAVDSTVSEIYVADAGDGVIYTVPVAGGAPTARAAYAFDPDAPSGLAHDGLAALVFITTDPPAIRGSNLPRIAPNFATTEFPGPTVGYGDLEFDRSGGFVLAANRNDPNSTTDTTSNFLFGAPRDLSSLATLASGIGASEEDLFGVAVDPFNQVIYFSTRSGYVWKRDAAGTVSRLISVSASALLGLELVPLKTLAPPFQFDPHGSIRDPSDPSKVDVKLVATTSDGHVFVIDARSETKTQITAAPIGTHLTDLVFSADGKLYVVDNDENSSRILKVGPTGTPTVLAPASAQLGRADGIEIDEGGRRLLVTSSTAAGDQLLAVDLTSGAVTALRNISIDDGFFPTGIVYDRLGTVVVRQGNSFTSLKAYSVAP